MLQMLACSAMGSWMAGPCVLGSKHLLPAFSSRCSSNISSTAQERSFLTLQYAAAATAQPAAPPGSYKIAIPTIGRAHTLEHRTLAALDAAGVDNSSRVDIFVASEQEAEQYSKALQPGTYANIIVGTLGIGKQRDFILEHYGAGANIVMMDDDIQWFVQRYDCPVNMHRVIKKGFELSHQHGCYMWGINNSSNNILFYMRPTYSVGWCYFQGAFMGFRVRDSVRLHPEFHTVQEDAQYSLMHCEMDGKLLRLNGIGLKARPVGKEPGGMQTIMSSFGRRHAEMANREYLLERYGRFIRAWTGDMPHPALKRCPEHKVHPLDLYTKGFATSVIDHA